jgi:hypothetical protein
MKSISRTHRFWMSSIFIRRIERAAEGERRGRRIAAAFSSLVRARIGVAFANIKQIHVGVGEFDPDLEFEVMAMPLIRHPTTAGTAPPSTNTRHVRTALPAAATTTTCFTFYIFLYHSSSELLMIQPHICTHVWSLCKLYDRYLKIVMFSTYER